LAVSVDDNAAGDRDSLSHGYRPGAESDSKRRRRDHADGQKLDLCGHGGGRRFRRRWDLRWRIEPGDVASRRRDGNIRAATLWVYLMAQILTGLAVGVTFLVLDPQIGNSAWHANAVAEQPN
jgi:hypothetical protein